MHDQQVPGGGEEQGQPEDHVADDTDIRPRQGRKIEVVGLLHEVEDGGGQDHDLGGGSPTNKWPTGSYSFV